METKIKIAIIEDNAMVVVLLKQVLTELNFDIVSVVDNGEDALIEYDLYKPDLMLVDIHLNGEMTGIDVVSKIKEKTDLPIIYLTGDLDSDVIQKCKDTFPSAYLKKPIDLEQLKVTIEIVLSTFTKQKKNTDKLSAELGGMTAYNEELSDMNTHLIAATFRERGLKKELENSKALIELQSKKIHDSINYSLRIQQSIIPTAEVFAEALDKHFVFYRPKDVVSGDFPWLMKKDKYVYFGAIDCTGHGVPGAMMSMIGNLLLNAIVINGIECLTPSEILANLHKAVVQTLKQDAEGNKTADGMDASLCRIDYEKSELLFSGAHLPMLFLRDGELETFKGDKFPVGGMQYRNRNTYSDHIIPLKQGDKFFIFSDGIIDQIGGEEKMKLMTANLRLFIEENGALSMSDFGLAVEKMFYEFMGINKQVDDVLLIGVEI